MTDERIVATPQGEARIVAHRARRPIATLALGHGAGGGIEAGDLVALAARLPRQDINVFLIEQPWRRAGKKVAPAPKLLDEAWIATIGQLRIRTPLVLGGRSAGARVACRTATSLGGSGVLALSFPLHPPGKPEKTRVDELRGTRLPTFVIQGEKDPFGAPDEFPPLTEMAVVPDADHSFKVPKRAELTQQESFDLLVEATLEWITRTIA
ncbi:hydrolase [Kribbella sp. NBC_01245]|uniref:alpha/beta hydrolase family protein n=1 Tax=Kribbella sp. NBC_01245 TaxID=2903578 RepID=UPI002E284CE6|nr:alpha/beta family hydrolase [Kribbella sp. NBC_01245]